MKKRILAILSLLIMITVAGLLVCNTKDLDVVTVQATEHQEPEYSETIPRRTGTVSKTKNISYTTRRIREILQRRVIAMSDRERTKSEYIQRYANQYCNGDVEQAKEHAIVKETIKELKDDAEI